MNTREQHFGFPHTLLVLALLAAFGPAHADDDEVANYTIAKRCALAAICVEQVSAVMSFVFRHQLLYRSAVIVPANMCSNRLYKRMNRIAPNCRLPVEHMSMYVKESCSVEIDQLFVGIQGWPYVGMPWHVGE